MTRSKLIEKLINQLAYIPSKFIEKAVKEILDHMVITLSNGERIEIRGFGSFSLHYRSSRIGRNPKNGNKVYLKGKQVPHFKPGKELRDRVNIYA
ncbi:MAG: integration host factor subunit beta [Arsenophonus sp. ET-DL9-MAG3]